MNRVQRAFGALFGFQPVNDGQSNSPGYPEQWLSHPFAMERLQWDYPRAVRRVSIVRACVLRIAHDIASLPVIFEKQSGEDYTPQKRLPGNLTDIWQLANSEQTSFELVRDLHAHLKSSGNAYMVMETFGVPGGKVEELWLMPPQYVQIIPGPHRMPAAYVFNRGGRRESIPAEFVIHFRAYNPDFEPVGASDLETVELAYTARYDMERLKQAFVRGGGMPAGYWRTIGPDGKPVSISQRGPEQEAQKSRLQKLYHGIANAFRPHIITDLDFAKVGLTPKEMDLIEMAKASDADICRALGVPPWLVGIKEGGGKLGSQDGAARTDVRVYWQNTITPEVMLRDSILTEKLCPRFEKGLRARTDFSRVLELNEPLLQNAQNAVSLVGRPVFTVNEVRQMVGKPPRHEPEADALQGPSAPAAFGGGGGESPAPEADKAPADGKQAPPEKKSREAERMIDGDVQRESRRKKAAANRARFERKMKALWFRALQDDKRKIVASIEHNGARSKRSIDLDALTLPDPDDAAAMEEMLASLVRERGEEALADLGLELTLAANNQRATAFVKSQVARVLSQTTETTRKAVREAIAAGLTLNETTAQIAQRVEEMPEFSEERAALIARTEVGGAYNFAAVSAYEQSGVVTGAEWLSSRDDHVRETHAEADGQVVSLGEAFSVGDDELEYPGDPSGDPSETCNCRCTVEPVVDESARARKQFDAYLTRVLRSAAVTERIAGAPGSVLAALRAEKGAVS